MTIAEQFRAFKTAVEFLLLDRYNTKLSAVASADELIQAFDDNLKPLEFVNEVAEAKQLKPIK